MSQGEGVHEWALTDLAPLPAPNTTSTRALRPRSERATSSAGPSRSRSQSQSFGGMPQLLYPGDTDSDIDGGEAADHNPELGVEASFGIGTKRRRSPSSDIGSNNARPTKTKRRVSYSLGVTAVDGHEPVIPPGPINSSDGLRDERSHLEQAQERSNDNTNGFEIESSGNVTSSSVNTLDAGPKDTFQRMMDEHLSKTLRSSEVFTSSQAADRLLSPDLVLWPEDMELGSSGSTSKSKSKEKAQQKHLPESMPIDAVEPLAAYTCPICFSPPSYATITPCGHVLCGECLFTAVKTTLQRGAYTLPLGERMIARCPVCRATIQGWDGKGGGVIGLRPRAVFSL